MYTHDFNSWLNFFDRPARSKKEKEEKRRKGKNTARQEQPADTVPALAPDTVQAVVEPLVSPVAADTVPTLAPDTIQVAAPMVPKGK